MQVRYKFWFENSQGYIFGKGAYELLKHIENEGSIRKASANMGISYRHAWGLIREIERNLNIQVVRSERGGSGGGSTTLTDEGKNLLREYERYNELFDYITKHPYRKPSITVDAVLVERNEILLVRRKNEPFAGCYALPGGFVNYGEKTEDAVIREVKEETNLTTRVRKLLGVYSDPHRDPRGHTITVVYEVERVHGEIKGGDDAAEAKFFPLNSLPELAFDHRKIIEDYLALHGM